MDIWYSIIEILPLEWTGHAFMKNALLAVILISPVFGILGTMVVNNRMAFFSDALGHGAFTGVAIGGMMGLVQPLWSAVIFSILFSIGIAVIKHRSRMASDTVIGVFSSTAIALGIFIQTSGGKSFGKAMTYLVGDILSILPSEILLLWIVLAFIAILWIVIFNKLMVVSVNPSLAGSRGIHTFWNELIFSMVIAVVVTVSMSWIGLLVINSFLVLPAAAARNIAKNQRQYHVWAIVISVLSGISGLIASYYIETASGATIVLISAMIFFATFIYRKRFD
ncbi:metal ABC transporter permease [Pseudobacteroides cellulosolvens]|uniref:ABC-type transporter, integral membrane subunit n=1 Tax=Pseudobacteroides cellulosolvens ATCC 35603 = DSM 2933 TaxID=398512 RepID=A0A0L6JV45_9FIRM|nr:metal ABC transporter permease [Pseudobacteroides cellulosolvens]KNY29297.1 ABC-type transporter, integral membrane subunit [Pseudobacteroides cellulosolvens ATCC 35603 = DSM 2933]